MSEHVTVDSTEYVLHENGIDGGRVLGVYRGNGIDRLGEIKLMGGKYDRAGMRRPPFWWAFGNDGRPVATGDRDRMIVALAAVDRGRAARSLAAAANAARRSGVDFSLIIDGEPV